jgi:probable rRNA maturation factor
LKAWISDTIHEYDIRTGDITIVACSDDYLLVTNRDFLNHDYYTDIITFDYSEKGVVAGDLLISVDRVLENAKSLNLPFENELHRVIIHGILHLLGFKDKKKSDKLAMTDAENKALKRLNCLNNK